MLKGMSTLNYSYKTMKSAKPGTFTLTILVRLCMLIGVFAVGIYLQNQFSVSGFFFRKKEKVVLK